MPKKLAILSALGAAALLWGCGDQPDNPTRGSGAGTQIQLKTGMNCYENRCFRYDQANGQIGMVGKLPGRAAPGLTYVSVDQFNAMHHAAFTRPDAGRVER